MGYIMSSLQISQGTFRLSDTKTLKIDHLSVAAGESWAFVGSNGSGKSALARALAGDLTLLSGQRESHFSRVTRLSFEQLQKLVSDEWQRNNTDLLSPGEEDTGRTTAEIIQDEVKDPAAARAWPNSLASAPCWTAGLNTCRPGKRVRPCCVRP